MPIPAIFTRKYKPDIEPPERCHDPGVFGHTEAGCPRTSVPAAIIAARCRGVAWYQLNASLRPDPVKIP